MLNHRHLWRLVAGVVVVAGLALAYAGFSGRATVTSATGGAPRPEVPARIHATTSCPSGEVFYTDGFSGNPGGCTLVSGYPLNTPAYAEALRTVGFVCPDGMGIITGDASNNHGTCR